MIITPQFWLIHFFDWNFSADVGKLFYYIIFVFLGAETQSIFMIIESIKIYTIMHYSAYHKIY